MNKFITSGLIVGFVAATALTSTAASRSKTSAKVTASASSNSDLIKTYSGYYKRKPNSYLVNMRLATLYKAENLKGNAENHYKRCISINPSSLEAYYGLCLLQIENKRYEDAISLSKKWLKLDPKSYYGHFCLADAMSLKGDTKRSIDILKNLMKYYPSDTYILSALKTRFDFLGKKKESAVVDQMLALIQK